MCADAVKNNYLTLRNHCVERVRGNVPIFEIVADKVASKPPLMELTMWSISLLLLPKNRQRKMRVQPCNFRKCE